MALQAARDGPREGARPAPPATGVRRIATFLLILPIRLYRLLVSPLFPPRCRFLPTCSEYAIEAIAVHGPLRGSWLALRRLGRCHPWGGSGYDPVPSADRETSETTTRRIPHDERDP